MVTSKSNLTKCFALVTGASQGLGLALCNALAKRKHNLIMVSLSNEGLADQAIQIKMNYLVEVYYYETDLTHLENCKKLMDDLANKQFIVQILVNNAGIGSNGLFTHFPPEFFEKQIALNCQTPVYMSRLLIPQMLQLPIAHILNIGSLGAFFDMPHKEVYVASKAFLISFSRSLYVSLKNTSIKVSIVCPGSIDTNHRMRTIHKEMKGIGKQSVMQTDEVAEIAIDGMFAKKRLFIPGRINKLLYWLNRMVPERIQRYFVDREMNRQERIKQIVGEKLRTE